MLFRFLCCCLAVWGTLPSLTIAADKSPSLPEIDRLVTAGIQAGQMPGAVVVVGTREAILHRAPYGARQLEPVPEPMTLDTVFDLASLTKPVVTATCVMKLVERGELDPHARVVDLWPEFGSHGKEAITIHHLLTHTSGLIADNHLRDYQSGPEIAWQRICELKPVAPVGERFIYSDVGFLVLGKLVERVSGETLDRFAHSQFFEPLRMRETGYCPGEEVHARCAPANKQGAQWIRGTVHDPRASALGGVAGHAGLFSTADDLTRYARMLLHQGELDGVRVFQPETVSSMLVSRPVPGPGLRTWGWDRQTGFSSNKGQGMSELAIGHGGFTGTGLWIDPERDLFVIFLSNRLHPDGKGAVNRLIGEIGTVAVQARNRQR